MACGCTHNKMTIEWDNSLTLPPYGGMDPNKGVAGAFAGFAGGKLVVAGGANFPVGFPWTGDKKVWWQSLYAVDPQTGSAEVYGEFFDRPIGYGLSVQLPGGVMCIGGCDAAGCYSDVHLIAGDDKGIVLRKNHFPSLPVPLANAAGALLGKTVYVVGGQESMAGERSTHNFFALDLDDLSGGWKALPAWPGPSRAYGVCAAQAGKIWFFSGRSFGPGDDFWVTQWTKYGWVRGQGFLNEEPPSYDKNYDAGIEGLDIPLISHEIGQYAVFPNLAEIDKYDGGNVVPLNFMAVREELRQKGRLDKAADYTRASGEFAEVLYKEDIERALRTEGFSGFQLLDLHDFPGQGTALVGLLDAFWDSKGVTSPEVFRGFCSEVVPLAMMPRSVYFNDQAMEADILIANFGREAMEGVVLDWKLSATDGAVVKEGALKAAGAG